MRRFSRYVLSSLFVLSVLACSKSKSESPQGRRGIETGEFAKDQARFKNAKERPYRARKYELDGNFDWEKRLFNAHQTIHLSAIDDVRTLSFDLAGPKVTGVKLVKGDRELAATFTQSENEVQIQLPEKIVNGEEVKILADYSLDLTPGEEERFFRYGIFLYEPVGADPIKSKALYTSSEPASASSWMLCDDHPQRRAIFKTAFTHAKTETFLANGLLLEKKDLEDGRVKTTYETKFPMPTYIMAFTLGNFRCAETTMASGLPTAYCMREGLPGDPEKNLQRTNAQIEALEKHFGPFPWEKYVTVLIPEFVAGGMENAGITFNHESLVDMDSYRGANVAAHELAHHWYGDYITVSTWDDLWIKEGMATFMADVVVQPFGKKASDTNPSFYQQPWDFFEKDAVIDPTLAPHEKYTSGPYDRGSWFYSQLRSAIGADKFFEILRKVLADHKFSHIGTDEYLGYFLPHLPGLSLEKLKSALYAKDLGKFKVTKTSDQQYTISFVDPSGSTIVVPNYEVVNADGTSELRSLAAGPTSVSLQNSVVVPDPNSVHGPLDAFVDSESQNLWKEITSLAAFTPQSIGDFLGDLNPRARLGVLKASEKLEDTHVLDQFLVRTESRIEGDFLLEILCSRPAISDVVAVKLNLEAKELLADTFYTGFNYQACSELFDPQLYVDFDQGAQRDEAGIAKHASLGMDLARAKSVFIPLLSSDQPMSVKRSVVRALDNKFTNNFIRTLSAAEKTEFLALLNPLLPAYKNTRQEATLTRITKAMSLR